MIYTALTCALLWGGYEKKKMLHTSSKKWRNMQTMLWNFKIIELECKPLTLNFSLNWSQNPLSANLQISNGKLVVIKFHD